MDTSDSMILMILFYITFFLYIIIFFLLIPQIIWSAIYFIKKTLTYLIMYVLIMQLLNSLNVFNNDNKIIIQFHKCI